MFLIRKPSTCARCWQLRAVRSVPFGNPGAMRMEVAAAVIDLLGLGERSTFPGRRRSHRLPDWELAIRRENPVGHHGRKLVAMGNEIE